MISNAVPSNSLQAILDQSNESLSAGEWETIYVETVSKNNLIDIDNIIDLEVKTEQNVVSFIKQRCLDKEFCTWAGQTLISVHPYEDIAPGRCENASAPCVDSVVSRAWFKLSRDVGKRNQAIVISGESGSGKTYSACLAMKSIASLKNVASSDAILWQTWYSVPLLTAFGNAPNEHNNNSSRFGKLLQLQLKDDEIVGAYVQTFLLEKCRVTGPNTHEGNFHIFRQMLDSLDADSLSNLHLDANVNYKIAPPCSNVIRSTYSESVKAFKMLEITELEEIQTILAVILNLGNVGFGLKDDKCYVNKESQKFLDNASKLLNVNSDLLFESLIIKTFSAKRRETVYTSYCSNREECIERRNCLMRFLYHNLFLWLIDRINEKICATGDYKLLGILDIYGFEVFDNNTFEQLCINYANERLQEYFVNDHLVRQKEELLEDGFEVGEIDVSIYVERIELLHSIFAILNEECLVKRFNSDLFVNFRLCENLGGNRFFVRSRNNFSTTFVIRHFAGDVAYNTKSMLYKNRDKIPDEMIGFLKNCKLPFLECILQTDRELPGKTSLRKFKKSLDDLFATLDESDVHYVKCIKPNNFQIGGFVDEPFVLNQLKANGILDILKLSFQGFNIKYPLEEFQKRISTNTFNCLEYVFGDLIRIGSKYVYLSEEAFCGFETLKFVERSCAARKIQKRWLKHMEIKTIAAIRIQRFFRRKIQLRKSNATTENSIHKTSSTNLTTDQFTTSCMKAEEYLRVHHVSANYDGEPLSLNLEKIYNSLSTKQFKRVLFFGDRIISYNRLAEVPVRLHLRKSCIPHANLLPKSELPKGLNDVF